MLLSEHRAATAEIIILELMRGIPDRREFTAMDRDLHALPVLASDDKAWRISRHLAFDLRTGGITVPTVDLVIASLAMRHDAVLLHADRHFHLVAQRAALAQRRCGGQSS